MPINANLTFTTPLLNILDKGFVGGPDKLSKVFTDLYVKTLLTGLPAGTPSSLPITLPAPGLNPSAPPPYPIAGTAIPINNYELRKRRMQRIMKLYFQSRELIVQNGSIRAIIGNIRTLVALIPQIRSEISLIREQIDEVQREVSRLPRLLRDIQVVVEDILLTEISQLADLTIRLEYVKVTLTPEQTRLFQYIRSFGENRITFKFLVSRVDELASTLQELESTIDNIPTTISSEEETVDEELSNIRRYAIQQILIIFRNVFNLTLCATNPDKYLAYFKDVAAYDSKYLRLVDLIEDYQAIYYFAKPELQKLRVKAEYKIAELRVLVNEKIVEQKELLRKKQIEKATKKDGEAKAAQKATRLKQIRDKKAKILTGIRKTNKTVKELRDILRLTDTIIDRSTKLKKEIEYQINDGILSFIEGINDVDPLTQITVALPTSNPQVVTTQTFITQQDIFPRNELRSPNDIMFAIGIKSPAIINLISEKLVTKELSTPYPLYLYLLTESQQYASIYNEVTQLRYEIRLLYKRVKLLFSRLTSSTVTTPIEEDIQPLVDFASLKDILNALYEDFANELAPLRKEVSKLKEDVSLYVNQQTSKLKEEVEIMLIQLIPVNSKVKDGKSKQELLQYRRQILKQKQREVRLLFKKIALTARGYNALKAFLITNIVIKKRYRYVDNEQHINDMVDSFFGLKILEVVEGNPQANNSQLAALIKPIEQQQTNTKIDIRALLTYLELFVDLIVEMQTASRDTDFAAKLDESIRLKFRYSPSLAPYRSFAQLLKAFLTKKPVGGNEIGKVLTNALRFINEIEEIQGNTKLLQSTKLQTTLIQLENEFFGQIKARYNQFATSELAQVSSQEVASDPDLKSDRSKYYAKLQTIIPQKPFEESILLAIINGLVYIVRELGREIDDFYKKYIQPELNGLNEAFRKMEDRYAEEFKRVTDRLYNFDISILLPTMLNLATRAFWLGFSWLAPDTTSFRVTLIGPIKKLKNPKTKKQITPDDGISGWVEAVAEELFGNTGQLRQLQGICRPPAATGIPPIPFIGYR